MKKLSFLLISTLVVLACGYAQDTRPELSIPPLMPFTMKNGEKVFDFNAQEGKHRFAPGLSSQTLGYGGASYLGPTIRVSQGDRVRFNVKNDLSEGTTVHWHGVHVPAEMDGNMHQPIAPGKVWTAHYEIKQPAGTLWYHPHFYQSTAEQVYYGLAGYYLIDDEAEAALPLPRDYGVDDIPLILQDKIFASGQLRYNRSRHTEINGIQGNVAIVNGAVNPVYTIKSQLVRFRILNGSNSSIYTFRLSNGLPLTIIASDAGLLEAPVNRDTITLSPGERVEVLVDFSRLSRGDGFSLELETHFGLRAKAMSFRVDSLQDRGTRIPSRLVEVEKLSLDEVTATRTFIMETFSSGGRNRGNRGMMGNAQLTINGKNINMNRIDERIPLGATEIWEVSTSPQGMMGFLPHNFHIHDTSFQIISIDKRPPPPELAGWKDTVLVPAGSTVRFIVRFDDYTGLYMYHCHFLEHEDYGMMGQFEVYL